MIYSASSSNTNVHQQLAALAAGLTPEFDESFVEKAKLALASDDPSLTPETTGYAQRLSLKCAELLMSEYKATPNFEDSMHAETSFAKACGRGNYALVSRMLAYNAKPEKADAHGFTPLHAACAEGHLDIVQLLLEQHVFKDAPNNQGLRPIHLAVKHPSVLSELLKAGTSFDALDENKNTPLHHAVLANAPSESITLLLTAGADITLTNGDGLTPLALAQNHTSYMQDDHIDLLTTAEQTLHAEAEEALRQASQTFTAYADTFMTADGQTFPLEMDEEILRQVRREDFTDLVQDQRYAAEHAHPGADIEANLEVTPPSDACSSGKNKKLT